MKFVRFGGNFLVASILQAVKLSTEPKKKEELSLSAERLCKQLITINELHSSAGCHKIACAHLLLAEVYILTNWYDTYTVRFAQPLLLVMQ